MPLAKTKNVGTNMESIKKHHSNWPKDKKVAVALNQARDAGADIPMRKKVAERMHKEAMEV